MDVVLSEECFHDFLKMIHELTGITIAQNRASMVEARLRKRMKALSLVTYDSYLKYVKENRAEQSFFIDVVTTNETYFYRTPRIWDYIENKFLAEWFTANPKKVFTAWSAAASSGEEAHTLAIICQAFKEKNPAFLYQITGTDISNEMVGRCQQGHYSGRSLESFKSLRPELFQKYMRMQENNVFQILPEIKARIKFSQQNLFKCKPPAEKFDLILIRNVLIYFKPGDQETVLSLIAPCLAEDGKLIIGESESLSHIKTPFKYVEPLIYKRAG